MLIIAISCFTITTLVGIYLLARAAADHWLRGLGIGLLLYALIFALLIIQQSSLVWWLIGLSLVITAVDLLLARHQIIDVGEIFGGDLMRASIGALLVALFFVLPVIVVIAVATGPTPAQIALLLSTIALALASQLLAAPLQRVLDQLTLGNQPQLQATRATLRETADVLPRRDESITPLAVTEEEFVRLTRRALSHLGDLPRLASSPLTKLPAIERQLTALAQGDHTLARATLFRELLITTIYRLRPTTDSDRSRFDSSDAWRHYNALYYPYVIGLKPYSRRASHDQLDPASRQALEWFAAQVPERTLYNWQNNAAKLVAQYLREVG